ncbi:MAG: sugar transferase [Anaerolineaceae bacterium]|nr:sugar transferase [Anaerolineaceae bacterium]
MKTPYKTSAERSGVSVDNLNNPNTADSSAEERKAARMAEIFLNRTYRSSLSIRRMRLRMISRVIRYKLVERIKYLFDVTIVLLFMPFALLVALPIILAIKLDSSGPVFYKQVRVGRWGKPFYCYKFRSMYTDADARKKELMEKNEADEIVFKMRNDPRITRVGRIIRKLSIDELPQLINVLKGEMSLVGPRPAVPEEVAYYQFDYLQRLDAVPGITGLQQVSGRSDLEFKRWIELDLQYIQEQSLWKDVEILLKTIPAVITGKGAY